MATVRITNHIRQHVTERILDLYNKQINIVAAKYDAKRARAYIEEFYGPALMTHLDGVEREAQARRICPEWNRYATRITCTTPMDGAAGAPEFSVGFDIPKIPVRNLGYYETCEVKVPFSHPFGQHMREVREELTRLTREREELLAGIVNGVLQDCGSLRQVLEVWPSALEFMPPETVAQHNKVATKVTRREINEVPISVQATLLKAKLLGG